MQKEDSVETCGSDPAAQSDGALYTEEFFKCTFLARKVAQRLPLQATNWSSSPNFEKVPISGTSTPQFNRTGSAQSLPPQSNRPSLYEQAVNGLNNDMNVQKEVALGKRIGFYRLGKELGAGNFSKVRLGVHVVTKEKVAVKVMERTRMDQKAQKLLAREIETMELTHHPNIIRLFECVETVSKTFLIMEYAGGGELYTYVHDQGKLNEQVAKSLFSQVASAVCHLHSKRIVHRDIKAENVIFSHQGWVKLADFGFSCLQKDDNFLSTFCGSPPYAAPELFRDDKYQGPMVDVWALGVLLYFMLVGVTPFKGETVQELKGNILKGEYKIPEYVSIFAQNVITNLLEMDTEKRWDTLTLKKASWFKDLRFSQSYLQFNVTPDEKHLQTCETERNVWKTLHDFGITPDMIRDSIGKGARNAIIGIYRIVTYQHQVHDLDKERLKVNGHLIDMGQRKKTETRMNQKSKTCSII
ncbi:unnamed protein product [Bursaphelenchus okinawaensis]|uniref:non-specific serine/threonine protein kinase n=1 Tax=Bursaphelenchus okinawaensis TaxID=465554 RepID=A0A811K865_9BILA|nr:unnamed protein product [Bursaphelenchus okinawaensis]CAG9093660.1 unnamed protein product [Bursaphelenchus okinawaensis]